MGECDGEGAGYAACSYVHPTVADSGSVSLLAHVAGRSANPTAALLSACPLCVCAQDTAFPDAFKVAAAADPAADLCINDLSLIEAHNSPELMRIVREHVWAHGAPIHCIGIQVRERPRAAQGRQSCSVPGSYVQRGLHIEGLLFLCRQKVEDGWLAVRCRSSYPLVCCVAPPTLLLLPLQAHFEHHGVNLTHQQEKLDLLATLGLDLYITGGPA